MCEPVKISLAPQDVVNLRRQKCFACDQVKPIETCAGIAKYCRPLNRLIYAVTRMANASCPLGEPEWKAVEVGVELTVGGVAAKTD